MDWRVEILNETVLAEIEALPVEVRAGLTRIVELIEVHGLHRLHEPLVKHLEDKLWEMRPTGRNAAGRALDVTVRYRRVVIVAAFVKKTQGTPRRLMDLAFRRAREIV